MPVAKVGAKTKLCSRCRTRKRLAEFSPHGGRPDGLQSQCNACRNEAQLAHRQRTGYAYDRWYARAKTRALQRLLEAHEDEFNALFDQELEADRARQPVRIVPKNALK